jgi:hypothetical protein
VIDVIDLVREADFAEGLGVHEIYEFHRMLSFVAWLAGVSPNGAVSD